MTHLNFDGFNLSTEMLSAIRDMGFEKPSPIQAETIKPILDGRDIIGQAHTGTGKTAAYSIPSIEKIDTTDFTPQLLILCPTRELVIQAEVEIKKLTKYKDIAVASVYGGQQIERQLRALERGVQIVIGTPGRTMDHLRRGSLDISQLKAVVLDEADEMLDMGFREDIAVILKESPNSRQTIMFSATMEDDILKLTRKFQNDPVVINVITEKAECPEIEQIYFEVIGKNKTELLSRLIDFNNVKLGLIFCNTKSMVDELVESLKTRGHFADGLHGDLTQTQREKVMRKFRSGSTALLVATDVAGRGIDVNDVEAVFNFDLPRDDEDYIHRIGRTGRAGKKGKAFTFVSAKQVQHLRRIEKSNGQRITRHEVPTVDAIEETKLQNHTTQIKTIIEKGLVASYKSFVEQLKAEDFSSTDIAAALFKMLMDKESESWDNSVDFEETEKFEESNKRRSRNRGPRDFQGSRDNRNDRGYKDFRDKKDSSQKREFSQVDKKIMEMTKPKKVFDAKTKSQNSSFKKGKRTFSK